MTITIINEVGAKFPFCYKKLAEQVILACMDAEQFPYEAEVNLTITDDENIAKINHTYRQIDRSTDVLSFPLIDYPYPACFDVIVDGGMDVVNPDTEEVTLGDIVLSAEHVKAQALEYGHSEKREYAFLICHSMLHLFGYDHETPQEAARMEARQKDILDKMGIRR